MRLGWVVLAAMLAVLAWPASAAGSQVIVNLSHDPELRPTAVCVVAPGTRRGQRAKTVADLFEREQQPGWGSSNSRDPQAAEVWKPSCLDAEEEGKRCEAQRNSTDPETAAAALLADNLEGGCKLCDARVELGGAKASAFRDAAPEHTITCTTPRAQRGRVLFLYLDLLSAAVRPAVKDVQLSGSVVRIDTDLALNKATATLQVIGGHYARTGERVHAPDNHLELGLLPVCQPAEQILPGATAAPSASELRLFVDPYVVPKQVAAGVAASFAEANTKDGWKLPDECRAPNGGGMGTVRVPYLNGGQIVELHATLSHGDASAPVETALASRWTGDAPPRRVEYSIRSLGFSWARPSCIFSAAEACPIARLPELGVQDCNEVAPDGGPSCVYRCSAKGKDTALSVPLPVVVEFEHRATGQPWRALVNKPNESVSAYLPASERTVAVDLSAWQEEDARLVYWRAGSTRALARWEASGSDAWLPAQITLFNLKRYYGRLKHVACGDLRDPDATHCLDEIDKREQFGRWVVLSRTLQNGDPDRKRGNNQRDQAKRRYEGLWPATAGAAPVPEQTLGQAAVDPAAARDRTMRHPDQLEEAGDELSVDLHGTLLRDVLVSEGQAGADVRRGEFVQTISVPADSIDTIDLRGPTGDVASIPLAAIDPNHAYVPVAKLLCSTVVDYQLQGERDYRVVQARVSEGRLVLRHPSESARLFALTATALGGVLTHHRARGPTRHPESGIAWIDAGLSWHLRSMRRMRVEFLGSYTIASKHYFPVSRESNESSADARGGAYNRIYVGPAAYGSISERVWLGGGIGVGAGLAVWQRDETRLGQPQFVMQNTANARIRLIGPLEFVVGVRLLFPERQRSFTTDFRGEPVLHEELVVDWVVNGGLGMRFTLGKERL